MTKARFDLLVWVLIYVGLAAFALGISVQRSDAALGWGIAATGGVLVSAGVALIWVRSRMKTGG